MREKTYSFTIEEIPIIVTKKRMKNMYLRISKEDGSVRISAPHQMSDERIYRFAKERIDWIRVYREKYLRAKEGRREVRQLSEAELKQQKLLLKKDVEKLIAKWEPVMGVNGIRCYDTQDENTLGFLQCEDTPHQYQSRTGEKAAGVPGVCGRA